MSTLRSRIVPCLLLHDGGLVKTVRFEQPKYVGDPLNAVKIFNEKAVDELMFLDIDATARVKMPDLELLRAIAIESRMPLCYGGGIDSASLAAKIVSLGFEKISMSSAAIARPQLIREVADAIGSQSVVLTIDLIRSRFRSNYSIRTHNGKIKVDKSLAEMCEVAEKNGVGEICINAIHRDGTMQGYDLELAAKVRDLTSVPLTFSGGAGSVQDMQDLIETVGTVGAAAGSLFVFKGKYRAVLISYDRPGSELAASGASR